MATVNCALAKFRLLKLHGLLLLGIIEISASSQPTCQNTASGRHYIADDQAQLCRRGQLDALSGCCKFAELETCAACDQSLCCNEYESCVSCCLQPQNGATAAMSTAPRGAGKPETGYFSNPFDYCSAKCRTNAKSTVHENSYKSRYHHCFGSEASPAEAGQVAATPGQIQGSKSHDPFVDMSKIKVVAADQGVTCDMTCAVKEKSVCVPEAITRINNCETLKAHFKCEGGCLSVSFGEDQPAYVIPTAMRQYQPGACLVNQRPDMMTCGGVHERTRRLCPCQKKRKLAK